MAIKVKYIAGNYKHGGGFCNSLSDDNVKEIHFHQEKGCYVVKITPKKYGGIIETFYVKNNLNNITFIEEHGE